MSRIRQMDKTLMVAVGALLLLGTVMVYSASAVFAESRFGSDIFFFKRQLIWLGLGLIAMIITSRIDYHQYQRIAWPLIVVSLVSLVAVLFTSEVSGARRWLNFGWFKFQPSELFKYAMIIFVATMLSIKREKIRMFKSLVFPAMPIIGAAFLLILMQPNLGTVLVLAGVVVILFFVGGVRKRILFGFGGSIATIASIMVFVIGYKRARVDSFLAAVGDPLKASYQIKQSILAIGSGGVLGKGLGRGSAKLFYLPAPHTDFIFATIAEEGGFIIATAVLVLLALVVWRGIRIAIHSPDLLGLYMALGISSLIFIQSMTNLLVATGMIPATGLPLPFLSYGGSSLLFTLAGIGILLNISRQSVLTPQLFKSRAQ